MHLKLLMGVEFLFGATIAPVGSVMSNEWAVEARAEGRSLVVAGLNIFGGSQHGALTVAAGVGMQLTVDSTTLVSSVKASGRKLILHVVEDLLLEDLT